MWLKKSERGKLLHLLLAFYINYIRVRHPKASLHLRLLYSEFRLTFAQFNFAAARYRNPRRQPNGSSNWNPFPNFRLINELRPLTPGSNSKGARYNAPKSGFRVPRWAEPPGMSYSKGIADWRPHRGLRWLQTGCERRHYSVFWFRFPGPQRAINLHHFGAAPPRFMCSAQSWGNYLVWCLWNVLFITCIITCVKRRN